MARSCATPSGAEEQHERTLAHAQARHRDRQHLGDEHGGKKASRAVRPGRPQPQAPGPRPRRRAPARAGRRTRRQHVGGGRRVRAQALDAQVDGAHEPAPAGAGGEAAADAAAAGGRARPTSSASVPKARARANRVAVPRWRSPGLTAKPTMVMTGSTSQPVSRSSTTEANVPGDSPVSRDSRLTRSTSPADGGGQHVGHELAGHVVRHEGAGRVRISRASSTFCQRRADRTMPASVSSGGDAQPHRGGQRPSGHQVGRVERRHLGHEDGEHEGADGDAHPQRHRLLAFHPDLLGSTSATSSSVEDESTNRCSLRSRLSGSPRVRPCVRLARSPTWSGPASERLTSTSWRARAGPPADPRVRRATAGDACAATAWPRAAALTALLGAWS